MPPILLFQYGTFRLHSGQLTTWKVECEALTRDDWQALAAIIAEHIAFRAVEGIPRGGLPLAHALEPYATAGAAHPLLIVDDVGTTGASLEAHRAGREALGLVVFARGPMPSWVHAFWQWGL